MIDTRTAPYAALALRAALGIMFIAHGLTKLLVFTLPGTAAFFAKVGFPGWMAYPVTAAEIVGGVLLVIGVYPRIVAAALLPVLIGATSVHWNSGWLYSRPNGGWEYLAFWIAALVVQALLGDGAFALRNGSSKIAPALSARSA